MRNYHPYQGKRSKTGLKRALIVLLVLVLAAVLAFGVLLGIVLTGSRDSVRGDPQIMIVLGCQVKLWGPSILLQDRLDKALEYFEEHPDTVIVTSGAQGADEPSTEAAAMRDYLVERGVPAEQILLEERSTNTLENIRYSLDVLAEHGYDVTADIAVVSNGFHLARVRMIWGRVCGGTYNLSTLAAPSSHAPSRLKMYIREPLALVKSFLFDR